MTIIISIINDFFSSFKTIKRGGLKKFYIIPGIINTILIGLLYKTSTSIWNNSFIYFERFWNLGNFKGFFIPIANLLIIITIFYIYFLFYKAILLIILSPFFSYISERVEETLLERKSKFSLKQNIYFVYRGVAVSFKCFLYELTLTLVLTLLGSILPIGFIVPIMIFLLQSLFLGYSFIDYTLERYGFSSRDSLRFLRKNWIFSLVNGSIFMLLFFIPFVGIFVAPLIVCVTITTGTLRILEKKGDEL